MSQFVIPTLWSLAVWAVVIDADKERNRIAGEDRMHLLLEA